MKLKTKKTLAPSKELQDLFEKIINMALQVIDQGAEVAPRLVVIMKAEEGKEREVMSLPLEVGHTAEMRRELCQIAGRVLATEKTLPVEMFMTVTEAWLSVASKDGKKTMRDQRLLSGDLRPTHDPQREEVLFISGEDMMGNLALVTFYLRVKKDKRVAELMPFFGDKKNHIIWTPLQERRKEEKKNGPQNSLLDAAWMEYKLVKSGF